MYRAIPITLSQHKRVKKSQSPITRSLIRTQEVRVCTSVYKVDGNEASP